MLVAGESGGEDEEGAEQAGGAFVADGQPPVAEDPSDGAMAQR